jgi:hypothetical protein
MSFTPNPIVLSPVTFSGPVVHNNAAFSETPWTVMVAIVASTGYPLVASRFTFTINQSDVQNYATLTLAPNATQEQQVLLSGEQIQLYLIFSNGLAASVLARL